MDLDKRELATVLAALRSFQQDCDTWPDWAVKWPQLEGLEPMTSAEIDALCERINTEKGS